MVAFRKRQMSLQARLILRFLVLLIFVVCCFLAYVNWFVIKPLKASNEDEKRLLALSISNQIDDYIESQNQLSHRILSNREVFRILQAGVGPATSERWLSQARTLRSAMFQAIGPTINIRDMIIYDNLGREVVNYFGADTSLKVLDPALKRRLDEGENDQRSYILDLTSRGAVTFNRAIIDQNGSIYGYVTILLDQTYLQNPTENIADGYVYVVDEHYRLVASNNKVRADQPLPPFQAIEHSSGMYLDDAGNYVTYVRSAETGWITYVLTPRESVLGPVKSVLSVSLLIITVLLLVLLIYIYLTTKNLLLPIRNLRKQIARIQYSNLNVQVNNQSQHDELVLLHETFQELLQRLQQSIEREKQAVLEEAKARNSALQAQIAPHFIHNVLYLISIAAQEGKVEAVTSMCKHLSENLRYIVSSSHHHVSLADELAYIRHYLSLVQAHHEDDLQWEILADDSAKHVQIPRLSIQPFVENCIEHAFERSDPPWRIRIQYKMFNGIWAIEISDNGSGIELSKIAEIMAKVQEFDGAEPGLSPGERWGNMGIVNSVHRLQLMYQKRLFFNIFNNPTEEKGMTVQIIASLTDDFY
jgi:two-component system sensor histidine kinase YesM